MRRPGVVGGALTCDQVTGELIADGVHNHPAVMEVLLRCKGPEQVALISDMTDLAGLPDGVYETYGRRRVKKGLVSREGGSSEQQDYTIAGSVSSLDHNIGLLVSRMRVPLTKAIRMATLTPATIIGAEKRKGSLEPGKDADLVIMDEPGHVIFSMVKGKVGFDAEARNRR
jgi:N-acetylglucosamine-6-phosphate deacetylase